MADDLVERIDAEIKRQRETRGTYLDYGSPDPLLVEARARIEALETALAEAVAYMWTDPTHQRPPELHWHYDTGPAYEGWIITPLCEGEWKK